MKKELVYRETTNKLKDGLPRLKWLSYDNGIVIYDEYNAYNEIIFHI